MVLKYRYIGKGTTDSNGIAHMTEDADGQTVTGYTGTGAGEIDIVASFDDNTHISERSIQSEPSTVWDCIWFDIATTGKKSTDWTNSSNITVTTTDEGTTLSEVANYYSSTNANTGDFRLEFEIKTSGENRYIFFNSDTSKNVLYKFNEPNWVYHRITRTNGVFTFERSTDGATWTTVTHTFNNLTTEDCYFYFHILATDRTISYRNMKAYHI